MGKAKDLFLDALFPNNIACLVCNKELNKNTHFSLCDACMQKLPRNNGKVCAKCGEQITSRSKYCLRCKGSKPKFDRCWSPLLYEGDVVKLIRNFKYHNQQYFAETLGNFLVEEYVLQGLECDFIVPVPLHKERKKQRGFNQAQLLAKQMNAMLGLPVVTEVLKRVKNTQTQTELTKQEREANVKKAFAVQNKQVLAGRTVLLVDDVYTTGSTLNECASELLHAGASKVFCLTLAHTMVEHATEETEK